MQKKQILDIIRGEFINKKIEVVEAENKSLIGIKGKIIDETKNTFIIATDKKNKKTLLKNQITFIITQKISNEEIKIKINGKILTKRPEQRLLIKKL